MICQLCRKYEVKRLRIEKKVEIYECINCLLGFIKPKGTKFIRSYKRGTKRNLYSFAEYKSREHILRKRFERLIKVIKKYKKSGKVLDIGGGYGLFASVLQSRGKFKIEILEPVQKIRFNIKLEQEPYKTTFEEFRSKKKYDVIIMMDVLEHFKEPLKNLKKAESLLKKDGILVIQTPNYKSLMAKICRFWAWWMVEEHKFFFSPKSIRKILAKSGFEQKFLLTYEDLHDFKKNIDGNFTLFSNNILRKIVKILYYFIFFPVYLTARKLLWKFGYGGLIFIVAKKY